MLGYRRDGWDQGHARHVTPVLGGGLFLGGGYHPGYYGVTRLAYCTKECITFSHGQQSTLIPRHQMRN